MSATKSKKSLEIEPHWLQSVDIPQDKLLGAILCYGHKNNPIPADFQQSNIFWIYIGNEEFKEPDILANYNDDRLVDLLGPGTCDYVLISNCKYEFDLALKDFYDHSAFQTAANLLAPGGILYFQSGLEKILRVAIEQSQKKGIAKLYEDNLNITDLLDKNLDQIKKKYGFSSHVISEGTSGEIVSFIK